MIADPFDPKRGITDKGKPASAVYFLPAGVEPTGDLRDAVFIGLTDLTLGESMCACGHTKSSRRPGECVGCTGPECEIGELRAELKAIRDSLRGEPASDPGPGWERLHNCTCAGVGLRTKLAVLTGAFEHAAECKTNAPRNVRNVSDDQGC